MQDELDFNHISSKERHKTYLVLRCEEDEDTNKKKMRRRREEEEDAKKKKIRRRRRCEEEDFGADAKKMWVFGKCEVLGLYAKKKRL